MHSEPAHTPEAQQESKQPMTAGEAARQAQQADGGGRILSIVHAPLGYRVKLIRNGEVRIIFVPTS